MYIGFTWKTNLNRCTYRISESSDAQSRLQVHLLSSLRPHPTTSNRAHAFKIKQIQKYMQVVPLYYMYSNVKSYVRADKFQIVSNETLSRQIIAIKLQVFDIML